MCVCVGGAGCGERGNFRERKQRIQGRKNLVVVCVLGKDMDEGGISRKGKRKCKGERVWGTEGPRKAYIPGMKGEQWEMSL